MNSRQLEDCMPYKPLANNREIYPYTVEGQTRLAQDCRETVVTLGRANQEALERMDTMMAEGRPDDALKALDGYRVGRMNAARQRLEEALQWLQSHRD
jgi:hypothetical protein